MFDAAEETACRQMIELALEEDLGPGASPDADITSACFIDPIAERRGFLVARQAGVLAGLPAAELTFHRVDSFLKFEAHMTDGALLQPGDRIATVAGLMTVILTAERTALNFLQHLCGIATLTYHYVQAVGGCRARILDTRKTIPGWRLLAKYAVRQGGGHNHRMGLFDMMLVKDNHWAAMPIPRQLPVSFGYLRKRHPEWPIEIEVDSMEQLDEVLAATPDIVLLDNMPLEMMREAVRRRDTIAPGVLLEASGGVTLETVRAIAEAGVDRISVGALTHSAPALDIALDFG